MPFSNGNKAAGYNQYAVSVSFPHRCYERYFTTTWTEIGCLVIQLQHASTQVDAHSSFWTLWNHIKSVLHVPGWSKIIMPFSSREFLERPSHRNFAKNLKHSYQNLFLIVCSCTVWTWMLAYFLTHLHTIQQRPKFGTDKCTPSICGINVHPHIFLITWNGQETERLLTFVKELLSIQI